MRGQLPSYPHARCDHLCAQSESPNGHPLSSTGPRHRSDAPRPFMRETSGFDFDHRLLSAPSAPSGPGVLGATIYAQRRPQTHLRGHLCAIQEAIAAPMAPTRDQLCVGAQAADVAPVISLGRRCGSSQRRPRPLMRAQLPLLTSTNTDRDHLCVDNRPVDGAIENLRRVRCSASLLPCHRDVTGEKKRPRGVGSSRGREPLLRG